MSRGKFYGHLHCSSRIGHLTWGKFTSTEAAMQKSSKKNTTEFLYFQIRILESLRLEKTHRIIQSNHSPVTNGSH